MPDKCNCIQCRRFKRDAARQKVITVAAPSGSSAGDGSRAAPGSATFSGQHADQYEAMKRALSDAAAWYGEAGEYAEYDYLQKVPRTSLMVELVDALHRSGFQITKSPNH